VFHESRRSAHVPLKVVITLEVGVESESCDGETIVVGRHGALIATALGLNAETKISIQWRRASLKDVLYIATAWTG
jgi:hypothetical protein